MAKVRSFGVGEPLVKVGDVCRGFGIILAAKVEVTRYDTSARGVQVVVHGAGAFLGERAQLAGRRW